MSDTVGDFKDFVFEIHTEELPPSAQSWVHKVMSGALSSRVSPVGVVDGGFGVVPTDDLRNSGGLSFWERVLSGDWSGFPYKNFEKPESELVEKLNVVYLCTPRRISLVMRGLRSKVHLPEVAVLGPSVSAKKQAIEGFCAKHGVSKGQLDVTEDGKKYRTVVPKSEVALEEVLGHYVSVFVGELVKGFKAVLSCNVSRNKWPRPIYGITSVVFGEGGASVLDFEYFNVKASDKTLSANEYGVEVGSEAWVSVESVEWFLEFLRGSFVRMGELHGVGVGRYGGLSPGLIFGVCGSFASDVYPRNLLIARDIVDLERRYGVLCTVLDLDLKGLDVGEMLRDDVAYSDRIAKLSAVPLVREVACLCELPVMGCGSFDKAYLELPEEVVKSTLMVNQKYFLFRDAEGSLLNVFAVCVNDRGYSDEVVENIVAGNLRVLNARLEDAQYFYKVDTVRPLVEYLDALSGVHVHGKLGSVHDRVLRMRKIAGVILDLASEEDLAGLCVKVGAEAEAGGSVEGLGNVREAVLHAVDLVKCDLVTEMVQSFPELQGYVGAKYLEGEKSVSCVVREAVRTQYLPNSEGSDIPESRFGCLISLIEKFEKTYCMVRVGEVPTSSRDPFSIRRDITGIIRLITEGELNWVRIPFGIDGLLGIGLDGDGLEFLKLILDRFSHYLIKMKGAASVDVVRGLVEKVGLRVSGKLSAKSDASLDIYGAYRAVMAVEENKDNLEEYKRVMNIVDKFLKEQGGDVGKMVSDVDAGLFETGAEREFYSVFSKMSSEVDFAEPDVIWLVGCLVENVGVIGRLFDTTMIQVDNPSVSKNRISLLSVCYRLVDLVM